MIDARDVERALSWLQRGTAARVTEDRVREAGARIDRAWDVAKRMSRLGKDRTWQRGLTDRFVFACLHFAAEVLQLASDGKCDMNVEYDAVYAALSEYSKRKIGLHSDRAK